MSSATQADQQHTDSDRAEPSGRGRRVAGAIAASVVALVAAVLIISALWIWGWVLLGSGVRADRVATAAGVAVALLVLPSAATVLAWRLTRRVRLDRERVIVAGLAGGALAALTLIPILAAR